MLQVNKSCVDPGQLCFFCAFILFDARVAPVYKSGQLVFRQITDPSQSYQLLLVYLKN